MIAPASTSHRRALAVAALHLGVLWAFAVAQPLLDLLGDAPEFFVARENTSGDIIVLALVVTLVPPLLLTGIEALAALVSDRLRDALHLFFVAVLAGAFAVQLLDDILGGSAAFLIAAATVLGVAAAVAYSRTRAVPSILTVLSPAPIVFMAVFLLISPTSKLVLPGADADVADVSIPGEPPVIVILFDEFAGYTLAGPDGRVDAARYPNFARLANKATWYPNATTVADYTTRAVPAFLTGERPDKGAAPIASDHPESLFTLLGGRYSFDVTEPVTDVCPKALCPAEATTRPASGKRLEDLANDLSLVSLHLVAPEDLSDNLPPVDRSFGGFRHAGQSAAPNDPDAGARSSAALNSALGRMGQLTAFERQLSRAPRRAHLAFLHVQLPHNPYNLLPNGQRYPETLTQLPGLKSEENLAGGRWTKQAWVPRQAFQRYLLQIRDTDRLLGQMLDRLEARGLFDRSEIVVLADHGASFQAGEPHRAATARNLAEIAGIPLFIKAPGQVHGRVDRSNVSIIDVLATMADQMHIRLPWPTAGRPAGEDAAGGSITLQPQYQNRDLSLPFTEYTRRRRALVASMARDFGQGRTGLYGAGTDPDLIGKRVATLGAPLLPRTRFELDGAGLLASVNPRGPVVPSFISGQLPKAAAHVRLAVAVNGRVAATTRPFQDGDVTRFSAIVPARAFVRGPNLVELLAVTGSGSRRRIARLQGSDLGYRLRRRGTGFVIVDGSGREFRVVPATHHGLIGRIELETAEVRIDGYAADTERREVADRVLAFAGGRFLAGGRPNLFNKTLARGFGSRLARASFKLSGLTAGPRPGSKAAPVRVFALYGRRAYMLPRSKAP